MTSKQIADVVDNAHNRIIAFAQRVLSAPSLSGHEESVAQLAIEEMQALGYSRAWRDEMGNVIGHLRGSGGRTTMLHAHMDVVDPGDESEWRHPPFGAEIEDGFIYARGASDTKGSLVAQVYAAGLLAQAGLVPEGDVYVACATGEETGGYGTRHLIKTFQPTIDVAIIGEPSGNALRRGHRGRYEFVVTMHGRSAHASAPNRGLNPHYSMARFLLAIRSEPMFYEPVFGGTTIAPTLGYVDQSSSNVIPAAATVHIDWRTAPGETLAEATALVTRVAERCCESGVTCSIDLADVAARSYTGQDVVVRHDVSGFCLDLDDPLLLAAQGILEEELERSMTPGVWGFCTDGGFLSAAGVPCIGFGPGEEHMAHVRDERLSLDQLIEAVRAYAALAMHMGGR